MYILLRARRNKKGMNQQQALKLFTIFINNKKINK